MKTFDNKKSSARGAKVVNFSNVTLHKLKLDPFPIFKTKFVRQTTGGLSLIISR